MNDVPAVILNIQRQPGANIIEVVDRIKHLLPVLRTSLPSSVDVSILTDRTTTIRASVEDVEFELILSVALVVMVIFLFLRNVAATIIPSVAVPLSLIGTFGVMYLLGYSLNNLTLMALTISTGFVVDDAIVMIENIMRYIEEGVAPMEAALRGSEQIGFTILSLTVSLIAVLIPLLFMSDIVGRLFREFAITLSVTILVSAFVSLTLTPMMCSRLLRHQSASQQGRMYRASEARLRRHHRVLRPHPHRGAAPSLPHRLCGARHPRAHRLPLHDHSQGLLPGAGYRRDPGHFRSSADGFVSRPWRSASRRFRRVILKDPAVESLSSFIGIDGTNTTLNSGRIQINLKPLEDRKISASDVIRRLQPQLAAVEGITLYMQPVQDLTVEDRVSRTQYQYSLEDPDAKELSIWATRLVAKLQGSTRLRDVASDQQNTGLQTRLVIDRSTASRLGITPQNIDDTLYDAFGQRQVAIMFTQLNQYRVVLEIKPSFQLGPADLHDIFLRSSTGGEVPMDAITRWEQITSPLVVNHQGQFPVTTLSFNLAPDASLGDAVHEINTATDELGIPRSVQADFQGTAKAFITSLANEPILILAAVVTVYIVLGILYESYIHPITILSTLPSAAVGALLALMLCKTELSVIGLIGIVLLIGIVEKNAIMMIDFALEKERKEGAEPLDAIYQACLLRFRPIIMTTMAALLGGVPLALGSGVGQELRRPLGITIVGGLIFSQLLTLYTTPVIYLGFASLAKKFTRTRRTATEPSHV